MSAIANSNQPEDKPKTSRVKSYWRNIPWKKLSSLVMAIALCFYLTACGGDTKAVSKNTPAPKAEATIPIIEVSPPTEIQRLSRLLDTYEPQVSIISPKPDEVLNDNQVSIKFDVKNLPIFKNAEFGLGPHIHVTLDNQEYKALYDLNQTATFDHLSAGTHTIRAFASRPWHESFKNKGAYTQVSFNVLTKTGENTPDAKTPLLTYSRPVGTYGAEPVLLDFYLQNAPLHLLGKDEPTIDDWQVRATVNGQSFTFDRWEPIYIKGLKQGKNWVKLELLEDDGDAIANVFNSTAHVIDFQPNGTDTLSRLVRGEKIANIEAIVNPNYVTPTPEPTPSPIEVPPEVTPAAKVEAASPTPSQTSSPSPTAAPQSTVKTEEVKASPISVIPVIPVAPSQKIPEAIAPAKAAPITNPITNLFKNKVVPIPVTEKAKVAPTKVETAPIVEPVKATPAKAAPVTIKNIPITSSSQVAPVNSINKNYSFKRQVPTNQSNQSEVAKPAIAQPEAKAKAVESQSNSKTPALTDLSATTSSPIKVISK